MLAWRAQKFQPESEEMWGVGGMQGIDEAEETTSDEEEDAEGSDEDGWEARVGKHRSPGSLWRKQGLSLYRLLPVRARALLPTASMHLSDDTRLQWRI